MQHPITIYLDAEYITKLDEMVEVTARNRSWHISKAIHDYIKNENEVREYIKQAIGSADRRELISHNEVTARLNKITEYDRR